MTDLDLPWLTKTRSACAPREHAVKKRTRWRGDISQITKERSKCFKLRRTYFPPAVVICQNPRSYKPWPFSLWPEPQKFLAIVSILTVLASPENDETQNSSVAFRANALIQRCDQWQPQPSPQLLENTSSSAGTSPRSRLLPTKLVTTSAMPRSTSWASMKLRMAVFASHLS